MIFRTIKRAGALSSLACALAFLSGCANPNPQERYVFPFGAPPANSTDGQAAAQAPGSVPDDGNFSLLRVGDLIIITFSDQVNSLPRQEIHIPDSGEITLPYNVHVKAAGKTTAQLEKEIRDAYVPGIFVNLTVSVRTEQRAFFVDGEVKQPGRIQYTGVMTLMRAIGTAGGFTDFANRRSIELRRQNGQKFTVNYRDALQNPALDIPVYPNDLIIVKRTLW